VDSYVEREYKKLPTAHNDDIMSLDFHTQDGVLASSAYDGDIFIWSLDAEELMITLNMHVSLLAICHEKRTNKRTVKTLNSSEKLREHGRVSVTTPYTAKKQSKYCKLTLHIGIAFAESLQDTAWGLSLRKRLAQLYFYVQFYLANKIGPFR